MDADASETESVAACLAELEGQRHALPRLRPAAVRRRSPVPQRALFALACVVATLAVAAPETVPGAALAWSQELGASVAYMRDPSLTLEPTAARLWGEGRVRPTAARRLEDIEEGRSRK